MSTLKEVFSFITNETLEDYQARIEQLDNPKQRYKEDLQAGYKRYLEFSQNHSDTEFNSTLKDALDNIGKAFPELNQNRSDTET